MTPSDVLDQVRYISKTSTGDGTGGEAALKRILNDYYLRLATVFIDTNDDLYGRKAKTTLAVNANQEYYALPTDLVKVKRGEVSYDGTNWYPITFMDDNEFNAIALNQTGINNNFAQSQPYASVFGCVLYMRPIPPSTVSLGLRLWYIGRPSLITNISTDVFFIPTEYQGYLVYGITGEVATRQGDEALAAAMFQKWEDGQNKVRQMFAPRELNYLAGFRQTPNSFT